MVLAVRVAVNAEKNTPQHRGVKYRFVGELVYPPHLGCGAKSTVGSNPTEPTDEEIAQKVERRTMNVFRHRNEQQFSSMTDNPRVGGSNPPLFTKLLNQTFHTIYIKII